MLHFLKINLSRETFFAPEKKEFLFFVFVGRLKFDVTPCLQCVTLYEVANPNFYEGVLIFLFRKALFSVKLAPCFSQCINGVH